MVTVKLRKRVLVRLAGELGTKSARTRRRFLNQLVSNLTRALKAAQVPGTVKSEWSRIWIDTTLPHQAQDLATRVFGVQHSSEVAEVEFSSLNELVEQLYSIYQPKVHGRTFGIRVQRLEPSPIEAQELAIVLGDALLPYSAGVNLGQPQLPIRLFLLGNRAYAELVTNLGPGGLPLSSAGKTLALFSGGFDSPVAAWYLMRRGAEVELVHFDLGGCGQVEQALTVAQQLTNKWAPGWPASISVIDLAPLLQMLRERCDRRLRQVLLKRAMYRAAARLAKEIEAEALVTGEALAQVSSQTLRSLAVCEAAADLPILRPLIGMDKTEIIALARRIGTYASSEQVQEHCAISGNRVITRPRQSMVEQAERALEEANEELIAQQVNQRRIFNLATWAPSAIEEPPFPWEVDRVPSLALLVDIREPEEGADAGDLRLPSSSALEHLDQLDTNKEYVLLCQSGTRSQQLTSQLRERGYHAWSLRGGITKLRNSKSLLRR